jgi:hypothetical protein
MFGIKYPIIQGGMIWCSGWELASAVSNAGGLGIIGAGSMYPEILKSHIQKCKSATKKPFGVNLPLLYPNIDEHIATIIEEKVGEGSFIPEFQTYVSSNKKSFFITATDIIGEVSLNFPNNNDVYNYKINNKISLLAEPVDRNIKFNVTNNPNDIIRDVSQTFSFRVIPN